ncbi:MAG: RsmD family RNA methyltransferase [Ignavibacteria bacterium]|nr:RsmD family RNA methyltransferase [Ignavibacteria bacterium]
MRIISGRLKGRKLIPPKGRDLRPTSDRAKETLFNILASRYSITGAKAADLFCGTGAFGLECISRGAEAVVFVDFNTDLAKRNAAALGVEDKCIFVRGDALAFVQNTGERFDLLFADPPYLYEKYETLAETSLGISGTVIIEHSGKFELSPELTAMAVAFRNEGKAHFTIFQNRS